MKAWRHLPHLLIVQRPVNVQDRIPARTILHLSLRISATYGSSGTIKNSSRLFPLALAWTNCRTQIIALLVSPSALEQTAKIVHWSELSKMIERFEICPMITSLPNLRRIYPHRSNSLDDSCLRYRSLPMLIGIIDGNEGKGDGVIILHYHFQNFQRCDFWIIRSFSCLESLMQPTLRSMISCKCGLWIQNKWYHF